MQNTRETTVKSILEKNPEKKPLEPPDKATKKQLLLRELKEAAVIVSYLAGSLSILQTYKALILLGQGINTFGHIYIFSIVEALALGKIVVLAQKLPFLKAFSRHSLAAAVLYQSLVMTLIVDVAGNLEDMLFPRAAELLAQSGNPFVLFVTHQFAAMCIFIGLFAVRGLDEALGPGTLRRLMFRPPDSELVKSRKAIMSDEG